MLAEAPSEAMVTQSTFLSGASLIGLEVLANQAGVGGVADGLTILHVELFDADQVAMRCMEPGGDGERLLGVDFEV